MKTLSHSASKKELFNRLGLIEGDPDSEKLHKQMMDEAKTGRDILSHDIESVAPWDRDEPGVVQPYIWNQLMETARHQQVLAIYRRANVDTQPYYDRGRYFDGAGNEENWVISWCLWHSFRSIRHRKIENNEPIRDVNAELQQGLPALPVLNALFSPQRSFPGTPNTSGSFDGSTTSSSAQRRTSTQYSGTESSRRVFWDPVRELDGH